MTSFTSFLICLPHLFTGRVYAGVQIFERLHRVHLRACIFQSVKKKWINTRNPFFNIVCIIGNWNVWLAIYSACVFYVYFCGLYCSSVFLRAIISYMIFMFGVCLHIIMYFCFNCFSTVNHNGLMCVIVFVDFVFSSPEPYIIFLDVYFRKLLFIMI